MDPVLDGTGGGFGKHTGIPVREALAIFERMTREPNIRSVRAIIRIGREQVEARGTLDVGVKIAAAAFAMAVVSGVVWLARVPQLSSGAPVTGGVCLAIAGAMAFGSVTTRGERKINLAQIRMLREGATDALRKIAAHPDYQRKELDWSDRNALEKLVGKGKVDL